jgi:hypothetical protein
MVESLKEIHFQVTLFEHFDHLSVTPGQDVKKIGVCTSKRGTKCEFSSLFESKNQGGHLV